MNINASVFALFRQVSCPTTRLVVALLLVVASHCSIAGAQSAPASAPAAAKGSMQQQIDQAIADLSSSDWRTREKAVTTLWNIGPLAAAKLQEASRSKDPEVAARAAEILEKFANGIYPDTPKEVVQMLQEYRQGKKQLQDVVTRLRDLGPAGYKTLAILSPQDLRQILYGMLNEEKLDKARELLATVCETGSDTSLADLAVVCALTGQVDAELARIGKIPERSSLTEKCLAYLYRAKGDTKNAMVCARRSQDQALVKSLLIEQADWKALAELEATAPAAQGPMPEVATLDRLSHLAAYQRFLGNDKAAEEAIASLMQLAKGKPDFAGAVAKGLLINERPKEAMELLTGPQIDPGLAAALLSQVGRTDEAIALLERFRGRGDDAQLNIVLARMHVQNGNRKKAWELISGLFQQHMYNPDQSRQFMLMEWRLGFRKEVIAQVPQTAPWRGGQTADFADILGPLLGQPESVIRVWYAQVKGPPNAKQQPWGNDPNAAKYIAEVMAMFSPQAQAKQTDAAIAKLEKSVAVADTPLSAKAASYEAIGAVLLAQGRNADALKYYQMSVAIEFPKDQPEPAEAVFGRYVQAGDLSAEAGKWQQAADDYALAYKVGPKDAPAPGPQGPPMPPGVRIRRGGNTATSVAPITVQQTWTALFLQGAALTKAGKEEDGQKAMKRASLMLMGDSAARMALAGELAKRSLDELSAGQLELISRTSELESVPWYDQWEEAAKRLEAKKDYAGAATARQRLSLCCLSPMIQKTAFESYLNDAVRLRGSLMQAAIAAGKWDDAIAHGRKGMELLPRGNDMMLDLIPALDKAGKKEQADKLFEATLKPELARVEKAPESGTYHNAVAWLCARTRRKLDLGLEHGLKAVELDKSAGVMDTLAEVYFQKGDRAKAVETMTAAAALQPGWDYLQKQLARMKSGKPEDPIPEATEPQ